MSELTGGCACGAVRFEITAPLMGFGVCHCLDCQKAAGGGPAYVALAPKMAFAVTKGEAKIYSSKADSGEEVGRAFCADCGTPLWSVPGSMTPFYPVKVGALDDPSGVIPAVHLYTDSAQPWHLMHEGLPRFPKMPPMGPPPA
jgi:hypothetical protein